MKPKPVDIFFPNSYLLRKEGKCTACGVLVNQEEFLDELSKKEFTISGYCQKCQNKFFNEMED